jgi:phenylalanyl-tRNA synthetase beta chain
MRTTILAPLLNTAKRNAGRGHKNVAVYELGLVVLSDGPTSARILGTDVRPSDADLDALNAEVPVQPWYVGAVLSGSVERGQAFNAPAENWDWQSTIALAHRVVNTANVSTEMVATENSPWHPGRCAAIAVDGAVIGFAGELHPRVVEAFGLPTRACAFEIDLDALSRMTTGVVTAKPVFTFPKATQDVALVVDENTSVEALRKVVARAAGELLESADVFDIYVGEPVPAGKKSVAIALTFRVGDRTLTDAEVLAAREAAIAAAAEAFGAVQRA